MRIVAIAKTEKATGNATTIQRIICACELAGHSVVLVSEKSPDTPNRIRTLVESNQIDCMLGLHAFRAGQHIIPYKDRIPYIVVLGGTDVNEMLGFEDSDATRLPGAGPRDCDRDGSESEFERRQSIILDCLHHAYSIVSFTEAMKERVDTVLSMSSSSTTSPSCLRSRPSCVVIHQAVDIDEIASVLSSALPSSSLSSSSRLSPSFDFLNLIHSRIASYRSSSSSSTSPSSSSSLSPRHLHVFLWPGGLRRVKDPWLLVKAFQRWHTEEDSRVNLVFVGSVLDTDYIPRITTLDKANQISYTGVLYLPALCRERLFQAMTQSTCIVNSSISEGQCAAILEAHAVGRLVLARTNEGNASVVDHKVTGLLYDTVEQAMALARSIVKQRDKHISNKGMDMKPSSGSDSSQHVMTDESESGATDSDFDIVDIEAQAQTHVRQFHGLKTEQTAYQALLASLEESLEALPKTKT